METLRFAAGCALGVLGILTFIGAMILADQRGKKGKNGIMDIDVYRNNEQQGVDDDK